MAAEGKGPEPATMSGIGRGIVAPYEGWSPLYTEPLYVLIGYGGDPDDHAGNVVCKEAGKKERCKWAAKVT